MAENPATWNEVTWAVYHAINEWEERQKLGVIGFTLPMYIAKQLELKGLLRG